MTDIVIQADKLLSDAVWCRACKVEQPPFPNQLITDLVAEIQRLRNFERAVQDELTNIKDDKFYNQLAARLIT